MALKFYFDLMSQPSRAIFIYLKANKIPYQACPVALRKGEHFLEEFEKINPMKKVPVIDHNGFKLTESIAILRYISREFNVPDHWYPTNSQEQAKVDEFLEWQHLTLRTYGSLIFLTKVRDPAVFGKPVKEDKVAWARKKLETELDIMEKVFLKSTPFLNRNEISVADLIGTCEMEQPLSSGHDVLANRPILKAWRERVMSETQPFYDEAHIHIEKVKKMMAQSNL